MLTTDLLFFFFSCIFLSSLHTLIEDFPHKTFKVFNSFKGFIKIAGIKIKAFGLQFDFSNLHIFHRCYISYIVIKVQLTEIVFISLLHFGYFLLCHGFLYKVCDEINFSHCSPHNIVLCTCSQNSFGIAPMICLLLSSVVTTSRPSPTPPRASRLRVGK